MFEYIQLKNFKSFDNLYFNLLDKKGMPKKLVLIYGENGIGKSNIASAFLMLSDTLCTMDVRDILEKFLLQDDSPLNHEDFTRLIKSQYKDIETIIRECKMVDSVDPMSLEFGFRIGEKSGKYILETDNVQIIHERLEFTLLKNRGLFFDITPNGMLINPKIFKEKDALSEIRFACKKFWGKHSLLSILMHESDDKAEQYIKNQINDNFKLVINFFSHLSCKIKFGSADERSIISSSNILLSRLEKGKISVKKEKQLDTTAKMLTYFFKLTYRDIEKAYYKKEKRNNIIRYQLMISKYIAGQSRDIDFSLESTGTQSLIQQLPFMLVVLKNAVSVIDEFDTGIHDLLVKDLLVSLQSYINGQLILTTHNTLLMESDIPKESIYVINELSDGSREIQCITHYDHKIHANTNIRDQYMLGKYHGIPESAHIDFDHLLQILEKK